MTITVGIIGCGSIAGFHYDGLAKAHARIRWVCDLVEKNRQNAATRTGAQATADWRQVVDDPAVQAVWVLTTASSHREICLAAIAAGKAVVCEKTLALDPVTAWEITQAARRSGRPFFTAYMKRFLPAMIQARNLLPAVGRLMSARVRSWQPWGAVWGANPPGSFLHRPPGGACKVVAAHGGCILNCGGSHALDLLLSFLGRPTRVYATRTYAQDSDADLRATALFTGPGEIPCQFEALAHPYDRTGIHRDGWEEMVELSGIDGRLEVFTPTWNRGHVQGSLLIHYDQKTGCLTEHRFAPVCAFAAENAAFVADIAAGRQTAQAIEDGYAVDQLIAAVVSSAHKGQAENIAWKAGA